MSATETEPAPVQPGYRPEELGRRVVGPTALGTSPARLLQLTRTLALTDFKLRYFGSALGYIWQLMRPLMVFGVLYVVFTQFLKLDNGERFFPVALLLGIVMFTFVAEASSQSVRSLVLRESLVRKIEFPLMAVPLSTVLTAVINFGLNLIAVFIFLIISGGKPLWTWIELPFLILFLTIFVTGLAMLLSALFIRYRDVEPIWEVVLQVMFYGTPIFYTLSTVSEKTGSDLVPKLLMSNPFAATLQQARHAVVDPSHVSTAHAMGGKVYLLIPASIAFGVFALGFWVFSRRAPTVAENL